MIEGALVAQFAFSVLGAMVASGHFEAPIYIAVPVVVAVVVVKLVGAREKGRPTGAGKVLVRCRKGHEFTTTWSPFGSLTSIRLGSARLQRCPVGKHWSLVRPVKEDGVADEHPEQS